MIETIQTEEIIKAMREQIRKTQAIIRNHRPTARACVLSKIIDADLARLEKAIKEVRSERTKT